MKPADIWKPTSKDFIQNPYEAYKEIIKSSKVFKAKTGDFVVMDYAICKQILQDPSFETGLRLSWIEKMAAESARRNQSLQHVKEAVAGMFVQLNPPEQQKIRADFARSWPSVGELRKISEEVTTQVISELPSNFDAITNICRRIPLQVISKLLGLPAKESEKYASDGINLVQILGPYLTYRDISSISQATAKLQSFLKEHILHDEYVPTKLTKEIVKNYPKDIMINYLLFLFIAGYETTSSLLASCIYHLIKEEDHALNIKKYGTRPFIEEVLRLNSPVQITGRTNTKPVELSGLHIPKNSALTLCIGAANVDPSQFDQPDAFVWNRSKREHLSFGYGMHYCLGNQLAEIEAAVLIEKLLPHLDKLKMVSAPILRNQFTIKSYQSFDIAYT